jgi:hypothetical protein
VVSVFRVCVYACVVFEDMQDVDDSAETCFKEQVCVLRVWVSVCLYVCIECVSCMCVCMFC